MAIQFAMQPVLHLLFDIKKHLKLAEKIVKVKGTVIPQPELVAKYEERYQKFKNIYPTVKELF